MLSSGGQFPVSITFRGGQVFVLNAWGGASIAGFLQLGGYLAPVPSWTRDLGLGASSSTIFTGTPGQVGFTPDGSQLVVTTKNATDSVDVFADGRFGPSAEPTVTSLPGTIPFGFTFDAYGHLALVETGAGAVATFAIAPDGALTQLGSAATGQAATCWITVAPEGTLYASNAGSATESTLATEPGGAITQLGTTPTDPGTTDAVVSSDGRAAHPLLRSFFFPQPGPATEALNAASPADDVATYSDLVIRTARHAAVVSGAANADEQAAAVAAAFLPDQLRYRPGQPAHFAPGTGNGRGLHDDAFGTTVSLMAGRPLGITTSPHPVVPEFPHLAPPGHDDLPALADMLGIREHIAKPPPGNQGTPIS